MDNKFDQIIHWAKNKFVIIFIIIAIIVYLGTLTKALDSIFEFSKRLFNPTKRTPTEITKLDENKYTKEPFSYYSLSYQRIGRYKTFVLFTKWKPVYNIQMKIGYIGENPENIDVFIPINGKVLDSAIPPNIKYTSLQKDDVYINNYLSILFQNVRPGSIIAFSFHVITECEGEPIKKDLINIYNGKTKTLSWDNFDSAFNAKNEGFFKYLFK